MKFAFLLFSLTTSLALLASPEKPMDEALSELRLQQQKAMEEFRQAHKDWQKLPNEDYQKFFTEWSNKNLEDELKLRQDYCEVDEKLCLSEKDKAALEAQNRVAIKVVELRNEYAKSNPSKVEQKKVNEEIDRAADVNLCQHHGKNCDKLAKKDLDLVEQLKRRDARIEGMEAEFGIHRPEWREKKGDKEVRDFMVRRENELLALNLKLNDTLCHEYPKDKEFCLDEAKIEELKMDTNRVNCQHERVHQLYNLAKDDVDDKEKILLAGHNSQWESLEKKDCKYLLAQDRLGESLVPTPVVVAPPKEEIFGDNEDEKNPRNYDPNSCQWVSDLPRKISYMPGCGAKGACIGFVVCKRLQGEGKFVRTSTCSARLCGQGDAVACTKQRGYYTKKPKDESKEFVSEKLKRIFSGATKQ